LIAYESETYDSYGRLSQRAITLPSVGTYTYTWAYNATTGLLNTLTYPASYPSTYSLVVQYAYSNGILQSVTDTSDTPNVTVWTANTTNPAGQVTEETLGNGILTNRSFDAVTGWLGSDQSGVGGGAAVKNLSFLYDEVGDVTQRQDNNLGLTENAFYDNDYRLSYTQLNGTQNLSLTYDNTGNITSRSDIASGAAWTYSTTKKHAVTQAGSSAYAYTYDANGNVTERQGGYITVSSYNYPVTIYAGSGSTEERVDFSYGPDRKRWSETYYTYTPSSYETTDYIGGLFEQVIGSAITGTIYRHYIYAGNEPIAVYARTSGGTNTFSYMLSDHQGSVSDLTSSTGTSTVNESFTPYGLRRNPATWSGAASNSDLTTAAGITRQAYTFQTQMGLWMGLNHMNGRVEDSMIGRFLSADPHIPDPTNTQSYNRYSYVNNNPLTQVDPTGFINKFPVFEGGGSGWLSGYYDPDSGVTFTYFGSVPGVFGGPVSGGSPDPNSQEGATSAGSTTSGCDAGSCVLAPTGPSLSASPTSGSQGDSTLGQAVLNFVEAIPQTVVMAGFGWVTPQGMSDSQVLTSMATFPVAALVGAAGVLASAASGITAALSQGVTSAVQTVSQVGPAAAVTFVLQNGGSALAQAGGADVFATFATLGELSAAQAAAAQTAALELLYAGPACVLVCGK
jgi:RHS repeat-associated protein